jgi:3-hydroxymyristoyl/3-hydroxydecanoyl-(acyl carrier protein) dehydratase
VIEKLFQHDHPASQGHFPGNPIIPGAVLLSETARAIAAGLDSAPALCQVRSAKFLHPVRPGDRVLIRFSRDAGGEIRFTCAVVGRPVLTGQMACSAPPTAK